MVPVPQNGAHLVAGVLMLPTRLAGHVQLSIDDLVADAFDIGQRLEIGGGVAG
jgi:hypothetical protein